MIKIRLVIGLAKVPKSGMQVGSFLFPVFNNETARDVLVNISDMAIKEG